MKSNHWPSFTEFLFKEPPYIGLVFLGMIALMVGAALCSILTPIENKRYELEYDGKVVRCLVQFPMHADGKMLYWSGVVNLTQCDDGFEYLGVSNVKVLKRPKCGCG